MKKGIVFLMICLLLSGCASSQPAATSDPTETTAEPIYLTVYAPNEAADGFVTSQVEVPALAEPHILAALVDAGVLTQEVEVNLLEVVVGEDAPETAQLHVDFNGAFAALLQSQGTAGEYVLLGSVVNTFLGAYGAQTMEITIDEGPLETGHNVYDTPLEAFA